MRSSSGARRTSAGTDRALTRRSTRCRRVCLCYPWCVKQRIECSGANDVRLVADAYGDPAAPAVLLLHGGGQTRHSWGGTAKALAKEGFYAVSADLRGHGESDWDPTGDYSMAAALTIEIVLTAFFLIIIMGSTDARAPKGFAPIAIGLALTLIHLISIPVTNTSVNPARSTGVALFQGGGALGQLWLFWLAPIIGGALGAWIYKNLIGKE